MPEYNKEKITRYTRSYGIPASGARGANARYDRSKPVKPIIPKPEELKPEPKEEKVLEQAPLQGMKPVAVSPGYIDLRPIIRRKKPITNKDGFSKDDIKRAKEKAGNF